MAKCPLMTARAALTLLALGATAALAPLAAAEAPTTPATFTPAPLTATGVARAQFRRSDSGSNYLGVSVGTYILTQGAARDAFGNAPVSYGVALVQPYRRAGRGLRFDVAGLSLNSGGNRLFLLGGTVGYEVQALPQGEKPTAFARVGVGPAYFSYDADLGSGVNRRNVNGNKIGFIGSAEVGYTLTRNFILSARYLQTQKFDGLDFSGIELKLTAAAFKL